VYLAYVLVTVMAAAANTFAAVADFSRARWLLKNMARVGVPRSWLLSLGAVKGAGALGLLAGIRVPQGRTFSEGKLNRRQ